MTSCSTFLSLWPPCHRINTNLDVKGEINHSHPLSYFLSGYFLTVTRDSTRTAASMRLSGLRASQQWPWHKKSVACACLFVCFETVPPFTAQTSLPLFLLLTLSLNSRSTYLGLPSAEIMGGLQCFPFKNIKGSSVDMRDQMVGYYQNFRLHSLVKPKASQGLAAEWCYGSFNSIPQTVKSGTDSRGAKVVSDTRSYRSNPGKRRSQPEPGWWSWGWWERIQLSIRSEGQTNKTGWCRGCGP